jgi:hypothetical protein
MGFQKIGGSSPQPQLLRHETPLELLQRMQFPGMASLKDSCEDISRWLLALPVYERRFCMSTCLSPLEVQYIEKSACAPRAIFEASSMGELWHVFALDTLRRDYLNELVVRGQG